MVAGSEPEGKWATDIDLKLVIGLTKAETAVLLPPRCDGGRASHTLLPSTLPAKGWAGVASR